jgi:FkbM family methyltransferase
MMKEIMELSNALIALHKFYAKIPLSNDDFECILKHHYQIDTIESCQDAILFGTQKSGKAFLNLFRRSGIRVKAFSDNNKDLWGSEIEGVKVIPPLELKKYPDTAIIITSKYIKSIFQQLKNYGHTKIIPYYILCVLFNGYFRNERYQNSINDISRDREKIERVYGLLQDKVSQDLFLKILRFRTTLSAKHLPRPRTEQYFPGNFWKMQSDETYADIGAYTGDTLQQFLRHTKGKFKKYFALEPDRANFKELQNTIPQIDVLLKKIMPLNLGAGAGWSEVDFDPDSEASTIVKSGKTKIKIAPLDELFKDETITTIKMDVEGYESEALSGARNLIKSYCPKLAICVYHRPSDLWNLPAQILQYNPEYKFYLRHHQEEMFDTVLYAFS